MDFTFPDWLDAPKIASLGALTMAVTQYFKAHIPEKYVRYFAVLIGIALAIACDCYIGAPVNWIRAIVNGFLAAILADVGYSLLSKKGGVFSLPSKSDMEPPKPDPKPPTK